MVFEMSVFMMVSDGVLTAALLDNKCIGSGVEKIDFSAVASDDAKLEIKIPSLRNFKLEEKEKFFDLAKSIAGVEIKPATET